MIALWVVIVVESVALIGLALLYRSQGRVVVRQRRYGELLSSLLRLPRCGNVYEIQEVFDRVATVSGPPGVAFAYHFDTSREVAPGVVRVTFTRPEPVVEAVACASCGDFGQEGGCRVCGR